MTLVKKLIKKTLNLKLVILLECQNIKTFLQKAMFQIGLDKFLRLKKLKTLCRGHMLNGKAKIVLLTVGLIKKT